MPVPTVRVRALNARPRRSERDLVLYWMTSFRRAQANFALDRAIEHAQELKKPLVVLEALRVGYPFASDRLHAFLLQGMADNARRFEESPVTYFPYVEERADGGKGLLEALAARACVIVGDDWPCFFVPRMQAAAASRVDVRFEVVDSNGLYPMHATTRVFTTAHSFRVHLQKELKKHLVALPAERPLEDLRLPSYELPKGVLRRWPRAPDELLHTRSEALARLPIDHTVPPVAREGGSTAALARLALFIERKLGSYHEARNEPEVDGTSSLSPWLHFGHLSTHEIFRALTKQERWGPEVLGKSIGGAREGWWKVSRPAEAFLDQLVTWRELAFNMASHRPLDFTSFDSLPAFAKQTLAAHEKDPRPTVYSRGELERAQTHDPLWNATQTQLVRDGWFHNYLRMLWGKKILEWSKTPRAALATMEYLMGKYSLDGRDPVSWSGYLWVLGRYDRAWGPERPIFGKIRYMSSENTARKIRVKDFMRKYAPVSSPRSTR
ncbi:MAG: deoxyribodipyrimidine photolyase [Myxococcota bacterium]